MMDATGEPAGFALVGSQRGWSTATPGKVMQTILRERHGGPLVIVDEVEKSGEVHSSKGVRHSLTDALLPLLERMTAAAWHCPFFQIKFDMAWVNWVMTANSRQGLPEPLQSRCVVLDLPDLTTGQLRQFAETEGHRRSLPDPAMAALMDVFDSGAITNASLSLRSVSRMLDRASDVWGLQDIVWNADALILAGDLTNGPADRWAQVFQYLSEFIPPDRIYAFPGNHDYYHGHLSDDPALAKVTDDAGAHFVQKQALLHGDTRILCCTLWTDFNLSGEPSIAMREADLLMADYDRIGTPLPSGTPESEVPIMRRDRRLKPRETLRVHQDHRLWLEEKLADQHPCGDQGSTVIVTHHGPHKAVAGDIDTLSAAFHSDMSAKVHGTDIRNVSIGYAGELIDESVSYLRDACFWKT